MFNSFIDWLKSIYVLIANNHESLTNVISVISDAFDLFLSILIFIGGVFGIGYLKNLHEKSLNATFGYYAQLKVRIHLLNTTFVENKEYILDRFVPDDKRKLIDPAKEAFIKREIEQFIENANETHEFLKNAIDQVPCSFDWAQKYTILLDFLEDVSKLKNLTYYKWSKDPFEQKEKYFKLHNDNMESLLKDIKTQEIKIQRKMHRKQRIWTFLKENIFHISKKQTSEK